MFKKKKCLFIGLLIALILFTLVWSNNFIKNKFEYKKSNYDNTEFGTPEEFGAKINDSRDDTNAIQKALNKYGTVVLEGGTYEIRKTLNIKKSVNLISKDEKNPATIKNNGNSLAISAKAPIRYKGNIKISMLKDDKKIKIPKDVKVEIGDLIHIKSDKLWYWNNRDSLYKGEVHKVDDINSKDISLSDSIYDNYDSDENLYITIYKESNIVIKDIKFINNILKDNIMIESDGFQDSKYINNIIEGSKQIGVLIRNNYNSNIEGNKITLGTTKDINTGYGIQDYGGTNNKINNNTIYKVRRGVDISGITPAHSILVEGNKVYGYNVLELATGSSGYGSHSTAVSVRYKNNYSYGFEYGFVLRGKDEIVENNIVEENEKSCVEVAYGTGSVIKNNTRKGKVRNESFLHVFKDYRGETKIINNKTENTKAWYNVNNGKLISSQNTKI